jgi:hypothetical protein
VEVVFGAAKMSICRFIFLQTGGKNEQNYFYFSVIAFINFRLRP